MATQKLKSWIDAKANQFNFVLVDDFGVESHHAIAFDGGQCAACGRVLPMNGTVLDTDAHIQALQAERDQRAFDIANKAVAVNAPIMVDGVTVSLETVTAIVTASQLKAGT